jgi:hypothetical protein
MIQKRKTRLVAGFSDAVTKRDRPTHLAVPGNNAFDNNGGAFHGGELLGQWEPKSSVGWLLAPA